MFFRLRKAHSNLVGFKEFGGAADLTYAAEHITSGNEDLTLMVGVDTAVFHGCVNFGATGAITGIGNVVPKEVLHLVGLLRRRRKATRTAGARRRSSRRRFTSCRHSTKVRTWFSTTST